MRKYVVTISVLLLAAGQSHSQSTIHQESYRDMVLQNSQEVKMAGYGFSGQDESLKAAKTAFLPSFSAAANYSYTVNPLELTMENPALHFQGAHQHYGASLSMEQPVYAGGAIRAEVERASRQRANARYEVERVSDKVAFDADYRYWTAVACYEAQSVARAYRDSVSRLVEIVRNMVELGYVERNDLLMTEVKLNEAEYSYLQAVNDAEVARLAVNSLAGVDFSAVIPLDSAVLLPELFPLEFDSMSPQQRPEWHMAEGEVRIRRAEQRFASSAFLPKVHVGAMGDYGAPGYDFQPDMDPNFQLYVELAIPIFEWGKGNHSRKAANFAVEQAREQLDKVEADISLEMQSARYACTQAFERAELAVCSLEKASESVRISLQQYQEGKVSILEVISAQMYCQQARLNYIRSKLDVRIACADWERSVGRIR